MGTLASQTPSIVMIFMTSTERTKFMQKRNIEDKLNNNNYYYKLVLHA